MQIERVCSDLKSVDISNIDISKYSLVTGIYEYDKEALQNLIENVVKYGDGHFDFEYNKISI